MNFLVNATTSENFQMSTSSIITSIAICILMIVASWKIFVKAGEHGWASIIPFYNLYIEFKIAFGNGWYFLLLLVPIANIIISIMFAFKLAKVFGKGIGFGFGLLFLSTIFRLILAFGSAEYQK